MFYLFHNVIQCLIHTPSVNRCVPPEQHISFPFLSVGSVFPLFMRFLHLTPTSPQRQADSSKLPIPTRVPTATHSHAIPPSSPHSLPNLSLDPVPHCTGCPSQLPGERIASLCLLYPRMCQGTVRTTNNISPPPCFLAYPDARSFIIKSFLGKNTQLRLCFASYVFLLPSGSCDTLLTALNSAQHQHRVPGNAN